MLENLPSWATARAPESNKVSVVIEVQSGGAYKEWLDKLHVAEKDQYWLEVAYQCIKLDCQAALVGTDFDPRSAGKPAEIRFSNAPEYRIADHPPGRGVEAATQGREARDHYVRIRGRMPF